MAPVPTPLRLAALPRPRRHPDHAGPASAAQTAAPSAGPAAAAPRPAAVLRFAVGVAAVPDTGGSWRSAWAAEDGTVAMPTAQATDERGALAAAVRAALAAADPARLLELRIPDELLTAALAAGQAEGEGPASLAELLAARNVTFPWHPSAPRGQLVRRARAAAAGEGAEATAVVVPAPRAAGTAVPTPLLAATDGSKGRGPVAGWAFVTADGRHRAGTCPGNVLAAELTAVKMLLQHSPKGSTLHVLVDSRPALAALRDAAAHAGRGWRTADGQPVAHKHVLAAVLRLRADRTVTFAWVKGHAGQPLNDAADRLAVLARRTEESALGGLPLPEASRDRLVAGILEDMRAGLAASAAASPTDTADAA